MAFLDWIENLGWVTAVRESLIVYPAILTLHSVGMGIVVGVNTLLDLRLLGFSPRLPLAPMEKFFPVMWLGFWINLLSGLVLMVAAATKHLTDPVYYFKMTCVVSAVVILRMLHTEVFHSNPASPDTTPVTTRIRILAGASLTFWFLAIMAGRLTAYEFYRFWKWPPGYRPIF